MTGSELLVLSEADVTAVLERLNPDNVLKCVGRAMFTMSHYDSAATTDRGTPLLQSPLRISVLTPAHNMLFMPSRLGTESATSIKVVSVPRQEGDKAGLPATTLLFDEATGVTKAAINAKVLTAVRTAAASALALSLSSTIAKAKKLLIFGSGAQALWHARLVSSLASSLQTITIAVRAVNERSRSLTEQITAIFATRGVSVESILISEAVQSGGVIEEADIVCCCTPAVEPLFSGSRLKPGASLSMIGSYKPHMREVDLVPLFVQGGGKSRANRIILDSQSACLKEAGELYHLRDQQPELFDSEHALVELGTLLDQAGSIEPDAMSQREDEVTIFKCVGVGIMDSAISALVLSEAEKADIGTRVPF